MGESGGGPEVKGEGYSGRTWASCRGACSSYYSTTTALVDTIKKGRSFKGDLAKKGAHSKDIILLLLSDINLERTGARAEATAPLALITFHSEQVRVFTFMKMKMTNKIKYFWEHFSIILFLRRRMSSVYTV